MPRNVVGGIAFLFAPLSAPIGDRFAFQTSRPAVNRGSRLIVDPTMVGETKNASVIEETRAADMRIEAELDLSRPADARLGER